MLINFYFFRMKWISVNTRRDGIHEYHLVSNSQLKLVLKFNPETHSVRIGTGVSQRLFFLETAGTLAAKYLLKNEYGMEIGSLLQDKWHAGGGTISIESKKYAYRISNGAQPALTIYENNYSQTLVNCELPGQNVEAATSSFQTLNSDSSSLLLGLCWFLYMPVAEEKVLEYV